MLDWTFKKQKGMTLLEVIIVLGIMGVIAAGVVVLAQRAIDSQNVTKLNQALNSIQTSMISTYRSKKSYPNVKDEATSEQLSTALVSMGKLSEQDLINPFSGESIRIFTAANNTTANKGFGIRISNLDQNQCRTIVSNGSDLFEFIQVERAGGALVPDLYVDPNALAPTGVIKSTKGGNNSFDITNIAQVVELCGGADGKEGFYDVFVGGR